MLYVCRDTAGQERYASLAPLYYRGAAAAAIVYDITSEDSFRKAKHWVSELQKNAGSSIGAPLLHAWPRAGGGTCSPTGRDCPARHWGFKPLKQTDSSCGGGICSHTGRDCPARHWGFKLQKQADSSLGRPSCQAGVWGV